MIVSLFNGGSIQILGLKENYTVATLKIYCPQTLTILVVRIALLQRVWNRKHEGRIQRVLTPRVRCRYSAKSKGISPNQR